MKNNLDKENKNTVSDSTIEKMEKERIKKLEDAGIDERNVLTEVHKSMSVWDTYWSENRTRGKDDINFLFKDQWTGLERSDFKRLFKPALYCNKLYDPFRKILSEQRNNTPDLKVRSLTGKATQEEINLRTDIVKTIAYRSENDIIYQTAGACALAQGYGAFKITPEYENEGSFHQIPIYHLINDPNNCFWDPRSMKPHKGDGNYCGITSILSIDEFDAKYPNIPHPSSFISNEKLENFMWKSKDTITICDYYVKEWFTKIIYQLENGEVLDKEKYDELKKTHSKASGHLKNVHKEMLGDNENLSSNQNDFVNNFVPKLPEIIQERTTQSYKIVHYRVIQDKILEFTDFPSKELPIIFVDGDSWYDQSKQYTRSFIYYAKDTQRFLNYLMCEIASQIKNSQRSQWIGTPENVEGHEDQWKQPELQQGILLANPHSKTGMMPSKTPPNELPQTLLATYQRTTEDIKEVIGFYDANLGSQSNETSGVAIKNRALQGAISASIYQDNLNRAIEQGGRVVLDMIPNIMDTERTMTLMTKNNKSKIVTINKKNSIGEVENKISEGNFDIEISAAPSFAVQKEQALKLFTEAMSINPQVFPLVADLYAANFDLENVNQVVDRFKTLVPPEVLAKEEGKEPPPSPPDPQQQMAQMQNQLAMMTLKEREHTLEIREKQHELEEAKLRLEILKLRKDSQNDTIKSSLDAKKANLDYTAKMAKVLTDLHGKSY